MTQMMMLIRLAPVIISNQVKVNSHKIKKFKNLRLCSNVNNDSKCLLRTNSLGMDLFSSPFDPTAVDFLQKFDVPAFKIASCEITDHVLIKKIAETGKPVIISSGMASAQELQEAVDVLRKYGCTKICMLKCTAEYPAKKSDANLVTIQDMMKQYNVVGGLSDHTLGYEVPVGSVYLGASIIEKHFTLSRECGSADDLFSLEPHEWKEMVEKVREAESIIGKITYG